MLMFSKYVEDPDTCQQDTLQTSWQHISNNFTAILLQSRITYSLSRNTSVAEEILTTQ